MLADLGISRTNNLVMCLDTSAGLSARMLDITVSVMEAIRREHRGRVWLCLFDTDVRASMEVSPSTDLRHLPLTSTGGSLIQPMLKFVNLLAGDAPHTMVTFSDFFLGDWQFVTARPNRQYLWVLMDHSYIPKNMFELGPVVGVETLSGLVV